MKNKILVPVTVKSRVDDLVPSIERLAQPGTRVIFLMKFALTDFHRVLPLCAKMEDGITDGSAFSQLALIHSPATSIKRAEKKLAPAVSILKAEGVEATIAVYEGRLNKALRQHSSSGDACWVMSRRGIPSWLAGFLRGRNSLVDLTRRPAAEFAAQQ